MIKNILSAIGIIVMLVPQLSLGQNPSYGYIGTIPTAAQSPAQVQKTIWISTGQNWVKWNEVEYWKWAAANSYITTPCQGYPGYFFCTAPVKVIYNTAPQLGYYAPQQVGYQAPYYGNCAGYNYPATGFSNYGWISAPGISVSGGISLNGFPFQNANCQPFAPSCGNVFNPPSCNPAPNFGHHGNNTYNGPRNPR